MWCKAKFRFTFGQMETSYFISFVSTKKIRFIELWRFIPRVSKKVLLEQLKQMEEDNIIERIEFNDFPPKVFYKIHEEAKELGSLLKTLDDFGNKHIN